MSSEKVLNQTVSEYLFGPCSMGLLSEKALESSYWSSVENFILDNEAVTLGSLTFKQRNWLIKIKNDLLEG